MENAFNLGNRGARPWHCDREQRSIPRITIARFVMLLIREAPSPVIAQSDLNRPWFDDDAFDVAVRSNRAPRQVLDLWQYRWARDARVRP